MGFYDPETFTPDCSLGYLVRRVHQLGHQRLEPVFAAAGLTQIQWQALVSIWFGRSGTGAELARDLGYDKGATTRLLDGLEDKGWLRRDRDADDRRCVNLALTDEGRAVALQCRDRVVACWNEWISDWAPGEVQALIDALGRLKARLDEVGDGPCA